MAVGYHSEQEGHACPSIQKQEKKGLWVLLAIKIGQGKYAPLTYIEPFNNTILLFYDANRLAPHNTNVLVAIC